MHISALLASVATFAGEILTAIPFVIMAIISAIINIKKWKQMERHRETLHKKVIELLEQGKDVSGILKDED